MFGNYRQIDRNILNLVMAEICIQLINVSFMFILLIYMQKENYTDYEGARFIKVRFMSILLLSVPLGYYVKERRIKPLFYFAAVVVPLSSIVIIYAIEIHSDFLLYLMQITWGAGFVSLQVAGLPYILRNSKPDQITQGISMSHIAWSGAGMVSGFLIFSLGKIDPIVFNEKNLLYLISGISFLALYFVSRIKKDDVPSVDKSEKKISYDWGLIAKAIIPTTIIAIGAGLTIPFISIFFYNVHHLASENFALAGMVTLTLVTFSTLLVPAIKNRYGFRKAVPLTQSLAVIVLVILALTEVMAGYSWALYLALFCYIIRQPLMNMAAPMISEVTMMYVGEKNREMVSALTASIWSGSWFFSALVFEELRLHAIPYYQVFLVTAVLYSLGIWSYFRLIKDHERRPAVN